MWDEQLKKYDQIVDQCDRFRRKGKTVPYTSANGYMFSLINKEGQLGIRFSNEVQKKYIEKLDTSIFMSHGAIMKGYVLIPDSVIDNKEQMVKYLNESFDYAMTLPPK